MQNKLMMNSKTPVLKIDLRALSGVLVPIGSFLYRLTCDSSCSDTKTEASRLLGLLDDCIVSERVGGNWVSRDEMGRYSYDNAE